MRQTEAGLFFIVGCGRSGTTLLQVMLDSHPDLALPHETHFFCVFKPRNMRMIGRIETVESLERAVDAALSWQHIRPLGLCRERIMALVEGFEPSWETLFLALMSAFRERRAVPQVGEKTPAHIQNLFELYEAYPHARFIHMLRDPRAVVSSYMKAPFYQRFGTNPYHAINMWRTATDVDATAGQSLDPARYTHVRYEDLVEHPEAELQRLCSFLGVPFSDSMLDFHSRSHSGFLEGEPHKMGTLRPVYQDSTSGWREQLDPSVARLVEGVLGDRMRRLGYPTDSDSSDLSSSLRIAWLSLAYKARIARNRAMMAIGTMQRPDLGGVAEVSTDDDTPLAA